jgi:ABC-2 type transport system ATP-binding protein
MDAILSVKDIHKTYGKVQALKGVSFDVPKGSVFGILGPNGSGKTTLLGLVTNILFPTKGSYTLFGEEPTAAHRRMMGTFLETPNFYHYLDAVQNLRIAAAIKGRGHDDIDRVIEMVSLTQRKTSRFSTYSLGMKQRLAIASCLLGDPDVLILDEPTNGLDPVGIAEVRELIKQLRQQGKTIIMASHMLDEVEKVCTHVAILKRGDLIVSGKVDEILAHDEIVEIGSDNLELLVSAAAQVPGCKRATISEGLVQLYFATGTSQLSAINQYFFSQQIVLNHLQLKKKSLESKFFELTNA